VGDTTLPILGVYSLNSKVPAAELGRRLNLPFLEHPPETYDSGQFVVVLDGQVLSLCFTGRKAPGPVYVDFLQGASAHRRHFGGGKGQLIAKSVGIRGAFRPQVLDLTAGLGQDGFVLATLGCEVTLVERVPIVFELLQAGLQKALQEGDSDLLTIIRRLKLHREDSIAYLDSIEERVDVIYLDPMFPEKAKTAQVKKSMVAFQSIVGKDLDAGNLLSKALEKAIYRVVVKRPRKAPSLDEQYSEINLPKPGLVFSGKSSRFDIYPLMKMPS
jgi:16S rRNA (guanine1516-N2)-methyltransferase